MNLEVPFRNVKDFLTQLVLNKIPPQGGRNSPFFLQHGISNIEVYLNDMIFKFSNSLTIFDPAKMFVKNADIALYGSDIIKYGYDDTLHLTEEDKLQIYNKIYEQFPIVNNIGNILDQGYIFRLDIESILIEFINNDVHLGVEYDFNKEIFTFYTQKRKNSYDTQLYGNFYVQVIQYLISIVGQHSFLFHYDDDYPFVTGAIISVGNMELWKLVNTNYIIENKWTDDNDEAKKQENVFKLYSWEELSSFISRYIGQPQDDEHISVVVSSSDREGTTFRISLSSEDDSDMRKRRK